MPDAPNQLLVTRKQASLTLVQKLLPSQGVRDSVQVSGLHRVLLHTGRGYRLKSQTKASLNEHALQSQSNNLRFKTATYYFCLRSESKLTQSNDPPVNQSQNWTS